MNIFGQTGSRAHQMFAAILLIAAACFSGQAAAVLTAEQITSLGTSTNGTTLANNAGTLLDGVPLADKQALARDIAAYLAVNRPAPTPEVVAAMIVRLGYNVNTDAAKLGAAAITVAAVAVNNSIASAVVEAASRAAPNAAAAIAANVVAINADTKAASTQIAAAAVKGAGVSVQAEVNNAVAGAVLGNLGSTNTGCSGSSCV